MQYPNLDLYAYISSDKKEYACQDGEVAVMDINLTFADIKDPRIKKIYTVDKNGNADNLFKAGEPVYLKVEFDEPVRFSDNVANDHGLEIKMMDSNNNELSGKIVALKDTYLIIKFENTSISGDFVFTQVDLAPLFGNGLWDLNDIFGEKGKSEGISLNEKYRSDLGKNKINYGYDKSVSLITDIAGNPLEYQKDAQEKPLKKQVYSIYRNCYVDGVAPKIEDIYYTKNMYNSNVKEKLGTHGSTDPSDLNAGPGDKITYYAVFNEHLFANGKSMGGYTSKMRAVLNVKKPDKDGKLINVELDSWNITTPAPGVIDTKYKEAKTTVQFEDFILTEDMVCEDQDSKIRIKEIIFKDAVVTDMSGNVYDGEVDIDLNDNPIGFDLTKPKVTTVAGQSEKGYVPVYPTGGNRKQFCFPIEISDQTGTNLIDGTFSWINGIPGEKDYKFQYAVTESMDSPADDEWKTGYTGQAYSFTQIETTQYIHIRLFDDVQYNLGFTSLKIMPRDYAGNIGDQSFSLDYSIDTGLPSASVTNTSKTYDLSTSDVKAIINVEVNATDDNSGIQKVYYLWTDTDSAPPAEDSPKWKETVGSFEPGKNSVNVNALSDKITGSYTGVLYVKPVDMANNARVIRLGTFTHSDKAPEYNLQYSTEITAEAKLEISGITDDSAVVVMIKKPGTTDNYYVSVIDQNGYSGDILNNNSYTADPINDVYSWRVYQVNAQGPNSYKFNYLRSPDVGAIDLVLKQIIEGKYYGTIDITLLAGSSPGNPLDFDIYGGSRSFTTGVFSYKYDSSFYLVEAGGESVGPVFAQTVTLKAAAGVNDVYEVNITTSDVLDKLITYRRDQSPFGGRLRFNPDDSTDRMLSTLEGVKVGVSIKNLKVEDWGINDIDFKNSYIIVRRITNEYLQGYDGNIYAMINLEQQSSQTISLPAASNGYYPSGRYELEVVLKTKASGAEYKFYYGNYNSGGSVNGSPILVDGTAESDKFGFAGYAYYFENNEYKISEQNAQYYGPIYGVKDEDGNPLTYSANNRTIIRIPANIGGNVDLYFTVDDMPDKKDTENGYTDIIGARAIKVWNETDGVDAALSKANAMWYYALDATDDEGSKNSLYHARFVDKAEDVVNAYGDNGHFAYLPLIKNTVNTIAFQVVNANGKVSEKRTVFIEPIAVQVEGTVSITDTDKPVKEGKLTFKPGPDQSMEGVNIYVYEYVFDKETGMQTGKTLVDITDKYDLYDNSYSLTLAEPDSHLYYVYTRDKYGNYTLFGEYEWYLTDDGPATVEESSSIDDNDEYGYFTARFAFNEISFAYGMEQTLKLYFDNDYMNLLGFDGEKTDEAFTLKLSTDIIKRAKNGLKAVYEAETPNSFGIYKVNADWQEVKTGRETEVWLYVTVHGINKYDSRLEDGQKVTRTLYATLTDPFGYESDPEKGKISFEVANTKPKYVKGYINEYDRKDNFEWPVNSGTIYTYSSWRFDAEFNTHVKLEKSIAKDSPSNYSMVKYGELPIFKDGTYTVSFYDIFGTKWTQEIVVEKQFNEYGMLISLSETGATAEPVEVMIIPEYMYQVYCTVYDFTGQAIGDSFEPFTVDSNMGLIVQIRNEEKKAFVQQEFYINNILKGKPQAELHWYYHEFNSDTPPEGVTETSKPVTVWYTADRKVFPSGGTGESYTFYPGEGITKYTFKFVDEAGNEGDITAELEIAIVEPQETEPEDTAPKYEIKIYARNNDKDEFRKEFNPDASTTSLKDTIKEAGYVQSYALDILVTEDSPYKFILLSGEVTDIDNVSYDGSVSEEIDGVTLNRNRITVTKPAVFTVVIVDKFNNKSSFTMDLGEYIDTTRPTAKVTEEYRDFYKLRIYVELEDEDNYKNPTQNVTLLSPAGLSYVNGKYYYEFTENKTITFYFIDMAGNIGSESITVNSLDRNPPKDSVIWSPCFLNEDGSQDPENPPYHLTNKDVAAIVKYDKPVVVTPSISFNFGNWIPVPEDEYDDYSTYFTLKATSDIAIVTFHQGDIGVKLTATALNGKTTDTYLYLEDIIVKTEPKITKQVTYNYRNGYESGTPVSATITLTPESIDVYCAESATPSKVISKGQSISFTVSKKGNYTYHFTDVAGNTSVVTVPVDKELDQTPPVITVKNDETPATSGNVRVPISLNEDGKLIVMGENNTTLFNGNASKDEWIEVEIENNGTYEVIAYDNAGNTANSVFSVGIIDKISPVITLDPVTVDIRQDSSEDALKALLGVGCIVTDNKSDKIEVTYNIDNVDLTVPGVYTVIYEAKDEVGNIGKATRFVRVYSKDELEVLINDKKTYYGGTTTVQLNDLKIKIINPLGNEPYTIYLSNSLRSEGQMKYNYTIVRPDSDGRFSVPSTGFYTLYIVTQSRQTYLIRLNVTK